MSGALQIPAASSRVAALDREEEALECLSTTQFHGVSRGALVLFFLLTLLAGIVGETGFYAGSRGPWGGAFIDALYRLFPTKGQWASLHSVSDLWHLLPEPRTTRDAEQALDQHAALVKVLRPSIQMILTQHLRAGNEQALVAPDGWLFFRKDWDSVVGPGFLNADQLHKRREQLGIQPDPLVAILDFRRQLAARGIRLLIVPAPVKPVFEGARLVRSSSGQLIQNRSYGSWRQKLADHRIDLFDPSDVLEARMRETGKSQYLQTDTHWAPEGMRAVSEALAGWIREHLEFGPSDGASAMAAGELQHVSNHGDTYALLGLPDTQMLFPKQTVSVLPVHRGAALWKADPTSEVLLLGDSFTNIFSLGSMGWGESAGFAEHLSLALGQPLDVMSRNSDGAFATRGMLQRELAAGRDRLNGKKLVIWEFASRELAFGDWRFLEMTLGEKKTSSYFCPPAPGKRRVWGTVAEMGPISRPGSVPYKEHIVALRLVDVTLDQDGGESAGDCLVYAWSMKEQRLTETASLRVGDRVAFEVCAWDSVAEKFERFQRGELSDASLAVEPSVWGEWIPFRADPSEAGAK